MNSRKTVRGWVCGAALAGLCLAGSPGSVAAAKVKGGGGGGGCTPNVAVAANEFFLEGRDGTTQPAPDVSPDAAPRLLPADGSEIVVARFSIVLNGIYNGAISADGFALDLVEGTPGGVEFTIYAKRSAGNCVYEEAFYPDTGWETYGSAIPTTTSFTIDNPGFPIRAASDTIVGTGLCVYVTARSVGATAGDTFRLGIDYSYTRGKHRKALNCDCQKYETNGLSNTKYFPWASLTNTPIRTFAQFVAQ